MGSQEQQQGNATSQPPSCMNGDGANNDCESASSSSSLSFTPFQSSSAPFASSVQICANSFSPLHLAAFAALHVGLAMWKRRRRRKLGTRDMDFVVGDFSALHHYVLVWMAIVTSPRGGLQLDVWLSAMAAMDVLPLAAAFAKVWSNGLSSTSEYAISNFAALLRKWSPAYQLNSLILSAVEYSLLGHAHVLLCCTVIVTQAHEFLSRWMYCRTIPSSSSLL